MIGRLPSVIVLAAALVAAFAPAPAFARDPVPQRHEVKVDFDVIFAEKLNVSVVGVQYTFTPEALERRDEVVAILRRHVRRPNAIWARAFRAGSQIRTLTTANFGGIAYLANRRLFGSGEVGVEYDEVLHDNREDAYVTLPFRLDVGGFVTDLVGLGAYYHGRPVILSTVDEDFASPDTERSGMEHEAGATLAFATPNDRLLVNLSGGYRIGEFTFTGFHPGDYSFSGFVGRIFIAAQSTANLSYYLAGHVRREDHDNKRPLDDDPAYVDPISKTVLDVSGEIGLIYWFEGRLGFRVSFGGGLLGGPPVGPAVRGGARDRGFGKIGVAFTTRF